MGQKANRAVCTGIEVVFAEIDQLYDLPGRRLIGSPSRPKVAIDLGRNDRLLVDYYRMPRYVDVTGEKVDGSIDDVPGMYQGLRVFGYGPFWRSFSRTRTSTIDKKYVYVFSADSPAGENPKLEHVLYFDKGRFRYVASGAGSGKGGKQDKTPHASLWLDAVVLRGEQLVTPSYFALLAPFRIPSSRLDEVLKDGSVTARSARVGDAFWSDGFTGGDPRTAKTLHELFKGNPPETLGYVVYLVDPFKEALVRLEPFQKALDEWLQKQLSMAADDQYVLAKRIERFARAYTLQELVTPKLPAYLRDAEEKLYKLRLTAEDGCENLLRWVAYGHQHDRVGATDVCYRGRGGKEYPAEDPQPYPTAWCNPFTEAVRDYLAADDDALAVVGKVCLAVQSRLAETAVGLQWMDGVFDDLVAKNFPVATAGAEMLFDGARKTGSTAAEIWAPFFKHWSHMWAKRAVDAKTLAGWAKLHKLDLKTMSQEYVSRTYWAMKKYRKEYQDGRAEFLAIDLASVRTAKMVDQAIKHAMVGFQIFNLGFAIRSCREDPSFWTGLNLVGAIADFYGDAVKLSKELEELKVPFKYAGVAKVIRVTPFVSVFSSTIDFVIAGKSALDAKTNGERIGYSMRGVGAVLTIVSAGGKVVAGAGEGTAETGWGIGLMIAGLALEAAGGFLVAEVAPSSIFLRHSEWGNGGGPVDRNLDRFSEGDFYGYSGAFARLPGDRDGQIRILNELIYDYDPKIELRDEHSVVVSKALVLRTGTPDPKKGKNPLNPDSKWKIELTIDHRDGTPPEKWSFRPDGLVGHLDASMNEPIIVKAFTNLKDPDPNERARGGITVIGTARLDPFGTGSYFIERKFEKTLFLGYGSG
jgi:hypothetical protein